MNILVFSNSAWDDTNALGNTLSNFFYGQTWEKDVFYNIYMRDSKPNNKVCKRYYKMTLFDMIRHFLDKENIGTIFNYECLENEKNIFEEATEVEQNYINFLHKHSSDFLYYIMDCIYRKERWNNKRFRKFVDDSKPDIVFSFLTNVAMLKPFIKYIKNNTKAMAVTFIADDVYDSYKNKSFVRRKKLAKDFEEVINISDKVYAISNELCEAYKDMFHKKIDVLYKGCRFDYPIKNTVNSPVRFVYAGNLFYGRDEILAKIAQAVNNYNNCYEKKAVLEIYTGANITENLKEKLNIEDSSIIKGKRNYDEIKEIMSTAEYNLHVESFEKKQIDYVKYSFSTKIIDCMQSGSCLIGIGPDNISSMKYIKKIPGAYVINNIDNIEDEVFKLIENKNDILKNAKLIREYAEKNHDEENNQMRIRTDFLELLNINKIL